MLSYLDASKRHGTNAIQLYLLLLKLVLRQLQVMQTVYPRNYMISKSEIDRNHGQNQRYYLSLGMRKLGKCIVIIMALTVTMTVQVVSGEKMTLPEHTNLMLRLQTRCVDVPIGFSLTVK